MTTLEHDPEIRTHRRPTLADYTRAGSSLPALLNSDCTLRGLYSTPAAFEALLDDGPVLFERLAGRIEARPAASVARPVPIDHWVGDPIPGWVPGAPAVVEYLEVGDRPVGWVTSAERRLLLHLHHHGLLRSAVNPDIVVIGAVDGIVHGVRPSLITASTYGGTTLWFVAEYPHRDRLAQLAVLQQTATLLGYGFECHLAYQTVTISGGADHGT